MTDETATLHFARSSSQRKNLVVLAGVLALVLLANGVVGLFSLHYANSNHQAAMETVQQVTAALEAARSAQVDFKKQVQEWKNILLRGGDAAEFTKYRAAFDAEGGRMDARLGELEVLARKLGIALDPITQARKSHDDLGVRYREALGTATSLDAVAAAAVDRKVRGIDRKPTDEMDAIVAQIQRHAVSWTADVARQTAERYQTLRKVSIAGTAAGLVVVLVFLVISFAGTKT